jgi:signal transduction histidine kinase
MMKKDNSESKQSVNRYSRSPDELPEKEHLNALLLDNLPHPAMIIRKDRTVLAANRIARQLGAKVGGYCWRDFRGGNCLPQQNKKYIDEHSKVPFGGTCCYFCLADEGLKNQQPTHNPQVNAGGKIWDTYWIPLNGQIYLHYAIDVTEQRQAEQEIRKLNEELERRVAQRTARLTKAHKQLQEKIQELKRLEKEVLEISMAEQQRIGQSLHDSLGQALTGVAFTSKMLEQKLAEKSLAETYDAAEISKHIKQVLKQTRSLAKGLLPIRLEIGGIGGMLTEFTSQIERIFGVTCTFKCEKPVLFRDKTAAIHIYHIAQEAVNNAIKHSQAKHISVSLTADDDDNVCLEVRDDGIGLPENLDNKKGMGLHIMRHRAEMIGGAFNIRRDSDGGTVVQCSFKNNNINRGKENNET